MLLQNLQAPDPRINNNLVRSQLAKHPTSMVDVLKFREVEDTMNNQTAREDIVKDLKRFFWKNKLGVGDEFSIVPFRRRKKIPGGEDDADFKERMDRVWDCVACCEAHLKLDTDLMFTRDMGSLDAKDEGLVQEYVMTFEVLIGESSGASVSR